MLKICLTVLAQLPIVAPRCPPSGQAAKQYGEVSEWLKEHAWKVCIRQRIGGSNPPLTAIFKTRARTKVRAFFFYILRKGVQCTPCALYVGWRYAYPTYKKLVFNHLCILFGEKIHQCPDRRQQAAPGRIHRVDHFPSGFPGIQHPNKFT